MTADPSGRPQGACVYESYDPATLRPTNDPTRLRLIELGWAPGEFAGRTVLDVGAGAGALSVRACQLGAVRVHAVDVQAPLVAHLGAVAARHALPIVAEARALRDLDPARDAADVVLLMEILHWLADQGTPMAEAVGHAADLTRDALLVETPWDATEPSIARRGLGADRYDVADILSALARRFREVRVLRFMTYQGDRRGSRRVLLRAWGRQPAGGALAGFRDAGLPGVSLARGANAIELATTTQGPRAVKTLAPNSPLAALGDGDFEALMAHLARRPSPVLVLPEAVAGRRRHRDGAGQVRMVLPFVGRLGDHVPGPAEPRPARDPLGAAVALRADLAGVPAPLIAALRAACDPLEPPEPAWLRPDVLAALRGAGVVAPLEAAVAALRGYDRAHEDAAVHADLQAGNMMQDRDGRDRVVDLDLMRTGTAWSDLLACAIYAGTGEADLRRATEALMPVNGAPPGRFDVDFALGQTLTWLATVSLHEGHPTRPALDAFVAGVRAVAALVP